MRYNDRTMKKETSIAVGIGAILGLSIAFFLVIYTKNAQLAGKKVMNQTVEVTPAASAAQSTAPLVLEIQSPDNGAITNDKSVTIKGKASKGNLLVIQSAIKNSASVTTDDTFSVDFPIAKGENIIHITLYSKDSGGIGQEKELRVYSLDEQ